ncbi:hypothetical protein ARZXY2_4477 (plasmid) [Arthrobacter sp. ZXY-2]|nr:hypothetical protein ARZXY2_4477 [Arthrobacter sp. ZXY-2]
MADESSRGIGHPECSSAMTQRSSFNRCNTSVRRAYGGTAEENDRRLPAMTHG